MKEMYIVYDNSCAEEDATIEMLAAVYNEADAQALIMDLSEERFYLAFLHRLQYPHIKANRIETDEEIIQLFCKRTVADWSWYYWYSKVPIMEE